MNGVTPARRLSSRTASESAGREPENGHEGTVHAPDRRAGAIDRQLERGDPGQPDPPRLDLLRPTPGPTSARAASGRSRRTGSARAGNADGLPPPMPLVERSASSFAATPNDQPSVMMWCIEPAAPRGPYSPSSEHRRPLPAGPRARSNGRRASSHRAACGLLTAGPRRSLPVEVDDLDREASKVGATTIIGRPSTASKVVRSDSWRIDQVLHTPCPSAASVERPSDPQRRPSR